MSRNTHNIFRCAATLLVAIAACQREPTGAARAGTLLTDRTSYVAEPASHATLQFTVITQFTNVSGTPIYLERAGGNPRPLVWYQQVADDGTPIGEANGPPCACTEGTALILDPGQTRTDTFTFSPLPLPSNFRVYIHASDCYIPGMGVACEPNLPLSDRVSATFRVDVPSLNHPSARSGSSRLQLR